MDRWLRSRLPVSFIAPSSVVRRLVRRSDGSYIWGSPWTTRRRCGLVCWASSCSSSLLIGGSLTISLRSSHPRRLFVLPVVKISAPPAILVGFVAGFSAARILAVAHLETGHRSLFRLH